MPGRSFRIARIAGIPVGISPWWLAIVALATWSLGSGYYPTEVTGISPTGSHALGLASVLLLFASILANEFGHALVARRRGVEVEEIDLGLLGGVSTMRTQPNTAEDELLYAAAGPAVTGMIALVFGLAWLALPSSAPKALHALIVYETGVNAAIFVFNLVPAFPLDGGRIGRALLWQRTGYIHRAMAIASRIGRGFGYVMIACWVEVRTPDEAIQLLEQHRVHELSLHDEPEAHRLIHWLIEQSGPDRWPGAEVSFHGHPTPSANRQLDAAIEHHSHGRGGTPPSPQEARVGG